MRVSRILIAVMLEAGLVAFHPCDETAKAATAPRVVPQRTFAGHTDTVTCVLFTPDGKRALSASYDKTLIVWDVASGKALRTLIGHTDFVYRAAISPDGKTALSSGADFTVKLWNLESGKLIRTLSLNCRGGGIAFSPSGKTALAAGANNGIELFDVQTGRALKTFQGHKNVVTGVAFLPDGKSAISSSYDGSIRRWDLENGRALWVYSNAKASSFEMALSPDGKMIVTKPVERNLILLDASDGKLIRAFAGHRKDEVRGTMSFSADGKLLVAGYQDHTAKLWDTATGHQLRTYAPQEAPTCSVAFSPDGRSILGGSTDHVMKLWDMYDGKAAVATTQPDDEDTPDEALRFRRLEHTRPTERVVFACAVSGAMPGQLAVLKDQIAKTISGLRPDQSFDLIFIHDNTFISFSKFAASKGLVPGTPDSKKGTGKFLDTVRAADGRADPAAGLEAAFELKPDLLYLLTCGDFVDNDAVIRKIRELNKEGILRINPILFVDTAPKYGRIAETMKTIARENDGRFTLVRPADLEGPAGK